MSLNQGNLRVLAAMRSYGSVTPKSFLAPTVDGGDEITRVAARVNELRDAGYSIETVMDRSAKGKRFARYYLRGEPEASGVSSDPIEPDGADLKTQEEAPEALVEQPSLFDPPSQSPYREAA